jgi:hypothetical protein
LSNAQVKPTSGTALLKKVEQRRLLEERSKVNNIKFRNIGPTVMSGRVDDIEVNPRIQRNFTLLMPQEAFGIPPIMDKASILFSIVLM